MATVAIFIPENDRLPCLRSEQMFKRIAFPVMACLVTLTLWAGFSQATTGNKSVKLSPESSAGEAKVIAKEAYIYGFPMVDGYRVMYSYFVDEDDPEFKAPWNEIKNIPRVYTHEDRAVQGPNSDTPYSFFGYDLRSEPIVLTLPAIEEDRYYSVQLVDLYTHNYAYLGSRTTGNDGGTFMLAGPSWQGQTPDGIEKVLRSETELGIVIYRTQLFEPADIDHVKAIQTKYKVQTLSEYLGQPAPEPAAKIDFIEPLSPKAQEASLEFFNILNFTLQFAPIHPSEKDLMARFAKIGVGAGRTFDAETLSSEMRDAIEAGMADAWVAFNQLIETRVSTGEVTSGDVFGTREHLDNNHLYRFAAARMGIWGNSEQEAVYLPYFVDASGENLNASSNRYTLHFAADSLPPVHAFWSLTMLEMPANLLTANPIDRYLINSPMVPDLERDADGGLSLYIQHESPGKDKESNWLPAPDGPFIMTLRLYWPKDVVLEGRWKAPLLTLANSSKSTNPATDTAADPAAPTDEQVDNLVRRCYQYVAMYNVISHAALNTKNPQNTGGWNRKFVATELADHTMKVIARPNNDTLYLPVTLDLRDDAVVIQFPAFDSKYVVLETAAYDHYVDIPLSTTYGDFNEPTTMLFYTARTKGYKGEPIGGIHKTLKMSGDFGAAFLRVMPHANEPDRMKRNIAAMKSQKVMTLSEFLGKPKKQVSDVDFPTYGNDQMVFKSNFLEVMQFVFNHTTFDPGDEMDRAVLAALEPLGVEPDKTFDRSKVAKLDGARLARVAERIAQESLKIWNTPEGNPYLYKLFLQKGQTTLEAMVVQSAVGPVGLPYHQAQYPGVGSKDGTPLMSDPQYVIRMTKDQLPPAKAFWSLTLYDAENGFFIPNDRSKYSVGENAGMKLDDSGGIEIHIAAEQPEGVPEENWLSSGDKVQQLDIILRVYGPDVEKMKEWTAPKAEVVE